jgi:hypothetical protein
MSVAALTSLENIARPPLQKHAGFLEYAVLNRVLMSS